MRALLQRVSSASVTIGDTEKSRIERGILIFLGIETDDDEADAEWLVRKIFQMRIFSDDGGNMNLSAQEIGGAFLVVSQFTLHASAKKGNRPSFIRAARPEKAVPLYEFFKKKLADESGLAVASGEFGADMQVALVNDGPVTIWLDSRNRE